jgi:hypothetical protein
MEGKCMESIVKKLLTKTLIGGLALLLPLSVGAALPTRQMPNIRPVTKTDNRSLAVKAPAVKEPAEDDSKEAPSISVNEKKKPNDTDLRCIQLIKTGESKSANETKIGFKLEAGQTKGQKIKVKSFSNEKPQATVLRKKLISREGRMEISRNDYFSKNIRTSSRKAIFKNTGLENQTIKARTLTPKDMRVPKAKSARRAIRHTSTVTAQVGSTSSGMTQSTFTPTAPGEAVSATASGANLLVKPELGIMNIKCLSNEGEEALRNNTVMLIEHQGRERTLVFNVLVKNMGGADASNFDVTAEHVNGKAWGTKKQFVSIIKQGQEFTAKVEVNIPWDVVEKNGHEIRFIVDKNEQTEDRNRSNNTGTFVLDVVKAPDLVITHVRCTSSEAQNNVLTNVRKSTKGKWLEFLISIKNQGYGTAYRFDIIGEHLNGMEWPTEDFYMVNLPKDMSTQVPVKVLIPQSAVVKNNHILRFTVDKEQVNRDGDRSNNSKTISFNLLPPMEPDLYFKKCARRERDDQWYIAGIQRGGIEFDYKIEIANQGIAPSPETNLNIKVQKIDSEGSNTPWLHLDRTYGIPSLQINKSHSFDTKNWWVYNDQSCRVDIRIDPDKAIAESNKGNNHRSAEFSVAWDNPFSGTWLGDLFSSIGGFFLDIGGAVYDGATWVYTEVKAATQYALAALMWPEMVTWVEVNYAIHYPQSRNLSASEKSVLTGHFPQSVIDSTRIQIVDAWTQPEMWGDGAGVTYGNGITGNSVIVIQKGKMNNSILVHEMVHAHQYKELGLSTFCWRYMYTWVKSGFSYRSISLEKEAYGFQSAYENGNCGFVNNYVGY